MPKIADTAPPACSGCGGQYPDRVHVDFESAWDGPAYPGGIATDDGIKDHIPVSIDELILCENCLREGFETLLTAIPDERSERLEAAEARGDELAERLAERERYIEQLEATVAAKPGAGNLRDRLRRPSSEAPATA